MMMRRASSALRRGYGTRAEFVAGVGNDVAAAEAAGLGKTEVEIVGQQGAWVHLKGHKEPVLNMCANNYLGLANHPAMLAAAHESLDTEGFGVASVRFICGTQSGHRALEEELAALHGMEAAILFPSCFDANAGIFEALLGSEDAVVSDALNHASIIDGVRLCKAQRHRYANRDPQALGQALALTASARRRLVVTDGVFSMDGTIAPLPELKQVRRATSIQHRSNITHLYSYF